MKQSFLAVAVLVLSCLAMWPPRSATVFADPSVPKCDATLWKHVYHGPTFATAQDRLKPIAACKTVTGTLHFVRYEDDGDAHLRLDVDPQYKKLLNAKNAEEENMLVVEDMCDKEPTQNDTIKEGVCSGWHQGLYSESMDNKSVTVTGAYVEDEEHGWREIHPVSSISVGR